jgi:hypothetical protein
MNNKVMRITDRGGRHFNVRILKQGDRYGADDCLVIEDHRILVEFFDATYENTTHGPLGQFTTGRYYASTLLEHSNGDKGGILLYGAVPEWSIDGEAMDIVRAWIRNQTEGEL